MFCLPFGVAMQTPQRSRDNFATSSADIVLSLRVMSLAFTCAERRSQAALAALVLAYGLNVDNTTTVELI